VSRRSQQRLLPIAGGLALGALVAWSGWFEPRRLVVRRLDVPIGHWPNALSGLTIGVVADLHVGSPHVNAARIGEIVLAINALSPDMVCLVGDYVALDMWMGQRVTSKDACAPLGNLQAPLGIYAVLGDHDCELDADGVAAGLAAAGITVLDDEAAAAGENGLWVAGIARAWEPEADGGVALDSVPPGAPTLALAHSPDVFPSLPPSVALTLAGHTHGGQVGIPALTHRKIPSRFGAKYIGGLYQEETKRLFVHTGIGTSRVPVRFLVPPQITLLTIRSGAPVG
jgi:predicted MPP superfamily phosphohydrolase